MNPFVNRTRVLFERSRRRFLAGATALAALWFPQLGVRGGGESGGLSRREADFYRPLEPPGTPAAGESEES